MKTTMNTSTETSGTTGPSMGQNMTPTVINGIDTQALRSAIQQIAQDARAGQTRWQVTTYWKGGCRTDTRVTQLGFGSRTFDRDFTIRIDEPPQLMGTNQFANPQEYLMAAMNACMMVGYATACAMEGIEVDDMRIETEGEIDLRGMMQLAEGVKPGYDEIRYTVYIRGNGTPEQFQRVHETVCRTSPNRFNIANPIRLMPKLVVE